MEKVRSFLKQHIGNPIVRGHCRAIEKLLLLKPGAIFRAAPQEQEGADSMWAMRALPPSPVPTDSEGTDARARRESSAAHANCSSFQPEPDAALRTHQTGRDGRAVVPERAELDAAMRAAFGLPPTKAKLAERRAPVATSAAERDRSRAATVDGTASRGEELDAVVEATSVLRTATQKEASAIEAELEPMAVRVPSSRESKAGAFSKQVSNVVAVETTAEVAGAFSKHVSNVAATETTAEAQDWVAGALKKHLSNVAATETTAEDQDWVAGAVRKHVSDVAATKTTAEAQDWVAGALRKHVSDVATTETTAEVAGAFSKQVRNAVATETSAEAKDEGDFEKDTSNKLGFPSNFAEVLDIISHQEAVAQAQAEAQAEAFAEALAEEEASFGDVDQGQTSGVHPFVFSLISRLSRPDGFNMVDTIVQKTPKGDRHVIRVLISVLDTHGTPAVEALSRIAEKGDKEVIAAFDARMEVEQDADIRLAIVRALHQLAAWGDESIIQILRTCLEDDDFVIVRAAAVEALCWIGKKDDPALIQTLIGSLQDPSPEVGEPAARALGILAQRGDQNVIRALRSRLPGTDTDLRGAPPPREVTQALRQLGCGRKDAGF